MTSVLALDVGGTKMAAGIVSADHRVLIRAEAPTPANAGAEELFDTAVFVLNAVLSQAPDSVAALGVGCCGPMRWPAGDVSPVNIGGWRGFPLRDRLADEFGLPTRVHNDAVCLVIGEALAGAGRGRSNVLGMVVSTGVGGGLVVDGRLLDGATGNAGHVGHVVVEPDGPACACGGRGCLEAVARGPALVAWAQSNGWTGPQSSGAALADAARAGDPVASEAFRRCGAAVGTAISSVAALLDLEVVAIGGGIAHAGDLVLPALFDAFGAHAGLEFVRRCRVVLAAPDSSLAGAAGLFAGGFWHGGEAEVPRQAIPSHDAATMTESRTNPSS